jgi:hypothetical protein
VHKPNVVANSRRQQIAAYLLAAGPDIFSWQFILLEIKFIADILNKTDSNLMWAFLPRKSWMVTRVAPKVRRALAKQSIFCFFPTNANSIFFGIDLYC